MICALPSDSAIEQSELQEILGDTYRDYNIIEMYIM
jgi:hypothetical protein